LIRYDDKCCTSCKVAMKKGTHAAKWVPIDKSRSISAQLICFSCYGKSEGEKDPFDKLAREGFVFGGRSFQFIFGESTSSNTSKATGPGARGAVAAATKDDRFGITAFFFATRDEPDYGLRRRLLTVQICNYFQRLIIKSPKNDKEAIFSLLFCSSPLLKAVGALQIFLHA